MQTNYKSAKQEISPRSFIEQARRKQIVEAAIHILANQGYVNLTFAKIARQAGLSSPGLISYHFKNKDDLANEIWTSIYLKRIENITSSIEKAQTPTDKLHAALESDLTYMGAQPHLHRALVEVLFSQRSEDGLPSYLSSNEESPLVTQLIDILKIGQKTGEFAQFDTENVALMLNGAKDQFLALLPLQKHYNVQAFTNTLLKTISLITQKGL